MNDPAERCPACGGHMERVARTRHVGEGEDTVAYHHYFIKCSRCGNATEDSRLNGLNAAGVASAEAIAFGKQR
jgi:YgiT-type zinc finger domain-containing protein